MSTRPPRLEPVPDPKPGVVYSRSDGRRRPSPVVLLSAGRWHLYERFSKVRIEAASVARRGATRAGFLVARVNVDVPEESVEADLPALLAVCERVGADIPALGKHGEAVVGKYYLADTWWDLGLADRRSLRGESQRPEIIAHLSADPVYDWDAANQAWQAEQQRRAKENKALRAVAAETTRQADRAAAWATLHGFTTITRGNGVQCANPPVRSLHDEVVVRTDVLTALLAAAGVEDLAAGAEAAR